MQSKQAWHDLNRNFSANDAEFKQKENRAKYLFGVLIIRPLLHVIVLT